ncbi:hypothetical protein GCM10009809_39740 [Isoptericola hypogeus]|uniref:Uncharacterized protein n=1 Tax=Isoptericola hypogeus TaxID=300179 RepID=A0ABN2JVC9_9MICO
MTPSTSVTFDVWSGNEDGPGAGPGPGVPVVVPSRPARPSAALLAVVGLGATLLGAVAALAVLLAAPQMRAPTAPPAQAPATVTLSPEQLEKLVVEVGDDEWVLLRRPHQPVDSPSGDEGRAHRE